MSEAPLTAEERQRVMSAILASQVEDDREPEEVVATDYEGNWDAYLRAAAKWLGIELSK